MLGSLGICCDALAFAGVCDGGLILQGDRTGWPAQRTMGRTRCPRFQSTIRRSCGEHARCGRGENGCEHSNNPEHFLRRYVALPGTTAADSRCSRIVS